MCVFARASPPAPLHAVGSSACTILSCFSTCTSAVGRRLRMCLPICTWPLVMYFVILCFSSSVPPLATTCTSAASSSTAHPRTLPLEARAARGGAKPLGKRNSLKFRRDVLEVSRTLLGSLQELRQRASTKSPGSLLEVFRQLAQKCPATLSGSAPKVPWKSP